MAPSLTALVYPSPHCYPIYAAAPTRITLGYVYLDAVEYGMSFFTSLSFGFGKSPAKL